MSLHYDKYLREKKRGKKHLHDADLNNGDF